MRQTSLSKHDIKSSPTKTRSSSLSIHIQIQPSNTTTSQQEVVYIENIYTKQNHFNIQNTLISRTSELAVHIKLNL